MSPIEGQFNNNNAGVELLQSKISNLNEIGIVFNQKKFNLETNLMKIYFKKRI